MARTQNEWEFRCAITDDREEINPCVKDIRYLQTKIQKLGRDFIIRFDESKEYIIDVRFINWLKYIQFNYVELNELVEFIEYKYDETKQRELEGIMTRIARGNQLPIPSGYDNYKYNVLLGAHSRKERREEIIQAVINRDPSTICYVQGESPFKLCSVLKDKGIFKIPQIESNLLTRGVTSTFIQFVPLDEFNINDILFRLNNVYSTSHVTWHQNTPHFFIYANQQAMFQHIVDKLIESDKLYRKIKSGEELETSRISERLIVINGDSQKKAQRLTAIGILTAELLDYNDLPNTTVDSFLQLADDLYQSNSVELKSNYDRAYLTCTGIMLWTEAENRAHVDLLNRNIGVLSMPTQIFKIEGTVPVKVGSLYKEAVEMRTIIPYVNNEESGIKGHQESILETVPTEYVITQPISAGTYENYVISSHIAELPDSETKVDIVVDEKEIPNEAFVCHTAGIMNATYKNDIMLSTQFNRMRQKYRSTGVLSIGSLEHLYYCFLFERTKDDIHKVSSNEFVPDVENAKERRVNNSTFKLLTIYIKYIEDKIVPTLNTDEIVYFMKKNSSLIILGAEKEPLISILTDFHYNFVPVTIRGYGDRAVLPNTRAIVPFPVDMNIASDVCISDIDQSILEKYDSVKHKEIVMPLIKSCLKIAKIGYFKLNILTRRILNEIVDIMKELCATPLIQIVRTVGQNLYTQEVFIEYDISENEREDNKPYFSKVTPMMTEVIEMYEGEMSRGVVTRTQNIIPKINEVDLDKHRVFILRVNMKKLKDVLGLISQYCTSINTRKIKDNDDELVITGNLDYRRMTMTRRAYSKDVNYKISNYDYDQYIPNGFGVYDGKATLVTSRILNAFTVFKEVTYKIILETISTLENIEEVVCVGSRNLTEINAIPINLKMVAYDKMSGTDPRLNNINVIVIEEWWDFEEMNFESNKVYLFLYVIPNNQTGLYRSEEEQIAIIKKMCDKVNSLTNCHVFVNFYCDSYNDVASRIADVPNFSFSDGKFYIFDYVAQVVRMEQLMAEIQNSGVIFEEKKSKVEDIYNVMLDQGFTCNQEYILFRGYIQEWFKLLHIKKIQA